MRKLNWDEKLSDDDVAWVRAAGIRTEEQIAAHQAQFDAEVPEIEVPEDTATQSALDPNARANTPAETGDGPIKIDPTQADPQVEDDYDTWTVSDLKEEVETRNTMADTPQVEVIGTGKNGSVTKSDLIKGLRLWDSENPEVPEPSED